MINKPKKLHPVMDYQLPLPGVDLSNGYDHSGNTTELFGAGGYMEKRNNMYTSELFEGKRNIHMGVDIWMPANSPVYAMTDGEVWGVTHNSNELDYGPTVILKHQIYDNTIYVLYGHLSLKTLSFMKEGSTVNAGDIVGYLGAKNENGGWIPHLHLQISLIEPEKVDMPGVVSEDELLKSSKIYPDPRIFLGPIYL